MSVHADERYCEKCGEQLEQWVCPVCGEEVHMTSQYCTRPNGVKVSMIPVRKEHVCAV